MENKTIYLNKQELQTILSVHFGHKIVDVQERMEEYGWSGQVWDDGPLPERLVGVTVVLDAENK
jgi:hypothetical protein